MGMEDNGGCGNLKILVINPDLYKWFKYNKLINTKFDKIYILYFFLNNLLNTIISII